MTDGVKLLLNIENTFITTQEAASLFGVMPRYFRRLVAANKFGLKASKVESIYLAEGVFVREDIERIAITYQGQRKSRPRAA